MTLVFSEKLRAAFAPPQYMELPLSGIDLSASGVKAVRLRTGSNGLTIASYVEARLPAGAFANGEIVDRAAVVEALKVAASATGISAANVSLPESKSYLFETTAVGADRAELRTSIEQHLDEFVPLPPAETVFDFIDTGHGEQMGAQIAGIGLARRIIDEIVSTFDEAGISVRALEGEVYASSRALLSPTDESTTLIIDVGKTTTKISIVAHRIPRFATTINIGGYALTLAVQKYFGVTEEEARKVKSERGIIASDGNEEYLAAMLSTVSAIRDEISRHLTYWQDRAAHGGAYTPVTRAYLIGGNAAVRGLPEYLEKALGIPVTAGNVFGNLASHDTWVPALDYTASYAYATAIGLALRDHVTAYPSRELMNLLPWDRLKMLARDYVFRFGVVVILMYISLVLDAAVLLSPTYVFLLGNATAKESTLSNIKGVLSSSDESALSARLATLSKDASAIIALSKKTAVSSVLDTVLAIEHPKVSLKGFTFAPGADKSKNVLTIFGTAATRDALRAYQLALESAPFTLSANLPVSAYAKDTDLAFTITVILKP